MITAELVKAYFLDRLEELSHQVSHGTPAIFISLLNLLRALANQAGIHVPDFMNANLPEEYWEYIDLLYAADYTLTNYYSLSTYYCKIKDKPARLSLSHDDKRHMEIREMEIDGEETILLTISAKEFLEDVKYAVNTYFDMVLSTPAERSRLETNLNKRKLVGYGY